MLSDAPASGELEIHFPDDIIESRAVIEQFLFLTTYGTLNRSTVTLECSGQDTIVLAVFTNLLLFLRKCDCESTLEAFHEAVGRGQLWGWEVFSIGVSLSDDDMCAASGKIPAVLEQDGRRVRYLRWDHVPDSVRPSVGLRYRYALHRFESYVGQWFDITPMPAEAMFHEALAEFDNLKEHPDFRYGDTVLISSDKWSFSVSSYQLQSAGFRMCSETGDGGQSEGAPQVAELLIFDNAETETADVLRQFLSLVVHGQLRPRQDREWLDCGYLGNHALDTYRHTVTLLQKHHCHNLIERFGEDAIKLMVRGILPPRVGFGLGLLAGDKRVCAASVSFYDPQEGRFGGRETVAAFVGFPAYEYANPLLMALDHVQKWTNGPGRSFKLYMAWRAELVHDPNGALLWYGLERELELSRFWDPEDVKDDILNWEERRDLERLSFKRHLARRFLAYVGKFLAGPNSAFNES